MMCLSHCYRNGMLVNNSKCIRKNKFSTFTGKHLAEIQEIMKRTPKTTEV